MRIGFDLRQHAFRQQLAAELARARPQIEQMIGRAQNIGVVLHHQNRVSQIAQLSQEYESAAPCRACAIRSRARPAHRARPPAANPAKSPVESAAPRRRKASTPAGPASGIRAPPRPENSAAAALRSESARQSPPASAKASARRKTPSPAQSSAPSPGKYSCAVFRSHAHRPRFGPQPLPAAIRALRVAAIFAQHHAHMQLVFLALQLRKESHHARESLPPPRVCRAAPSRAPLRHVAPRHIQRHAQLRRALFQIGEPRPVLWPVPRIDRAVLQSSVPGRESPGPDRNPPCCRIPGSAGTRQTDC